MNTFRASTNLFASASRTAVASSSRRVVVANAAPSTSTLSAARFSTSPRSRESAEKQKAKEDVVAGEAMGTESNKPASEGGDAAAKSTNAAAELEKQLAEKDKLIKELKVRGGSCDVMEA